jgi:hypothetical protein
MAVTPAKMLPALPRGNAAPRRFTLEGDWGGVTTLDVTITSPAGLWRCTTKWKSNTLLHVTAHLIHHGGHHGDTDNITFTVTNSAGGAQVATGSAEIAYADDADPP